MNCSLRSTLVLCDLDEVLLDENGALPQVTRDVLELFASRGGRFTVFSQRAPRAVHTLLGDIQPSAPALVCGGNLAYDFAAGKGQPLRTFAALGDDFLQKLPSAAGVGIALQMRDGSTRVLRMSMGLEKHLRREWTPFLLNRADDITGANVLRVLLYQDHKSTPLLKMLDKTLGRSEPLVRAERIAADTIVLTPSAISASAMLKSICAPLFLPSESVLVLAGGGPMKELLHTAAQSIVPADAPADLRAAATEVTVTDRAGGAAAEVLYGLVRGAEA